ncbi:alpha/beta hydrolase [Marinobacter adhaerens]|uniref:alpha/beta hydrolase n=1 Tax=Marinobacter adhaerens TaxID=1033846 RepID=UPI001E57E8D7|nr:alpha/beta hydrolase [Marinobacter adhaerens]MCD1648631.1 alpha/beta hydrolase [Marinobacter adhaerens]
MEAQPFLHAPTRELLDEQYDIEASISDFNAFVTRIVEGSQQARENIPNSLDIAYGPTLDETFDVFSPGSSIGEALRPAVFFVHGGYWKATTSKEWSYVAKGLTELGLVTVIENYALCPGVGIGEIVRQHRAAFSYLWRHAEHFGIDRERIVIVGHSAGAHGVAELLATDWVDEYGLPARPYRGAIAISGLYDLRPLPYTFVAPDLGLDEKTAESLSPILHIPESLPPLMLPYGRHETGEFRRQTIDYAQACSKRGLDVQLVELDQNHFNILDGLAEGSGPMVQQIREWLARDQH